jgi:PAS domain S-box-containing protein
MSDGDPEAVDETSAVSLDKLAETSPVAITKVDKHGNIAYANNRAEDLFGLEKSEITNRTYDDPDWKITYYDGTDYPSEELPFEIVKETGEPVENVRHAIEWPNGKIKLLSIDASPLFEDDGDFDGMVSVIEDVTEQIALEQREDHLTSLISSIRDVNQLLVKEDDRDELLEGVCDILIKTRDYYNVWVALLDEDEELITASQEGLGDGFKPMQERLEAGDLPETTQKVLGQSGVVVITDPRADCSDCPLSDNYEDRGSLTARLAYQGKVYGVISASTPIQYAEDEEEQGLFEEVAGDIGFGLHDIEVQEEKESAFQELKEKDERLELEFEGGNLGTWDWNVETDEAKFNERWAKMLGYSLDELEPRIGTWEEMVHPEDLSEAREKLNEHLEGNTDYYEAEFRMQHKSGDWIWVLGKGKVIERDEEGNPIRVCGTHLDITERKKQEEKLRRYKKIFEELQDPVMLQDKKGSYLMLNQATSDYAGVPKEELLGKDESEFMDEETYRIVREKKNEVLENEEPLEYDTSPTFENKGRRHIRTTRFPFHDDSGELVGTAAICRDITPRKEAELELRQSEAKFRNVFSQSPIAIELYDDSGSLFEANQACLDLFGVEEVSQIKGFQLFEAPNLPETVKEKLRAGKEINYESTFDFDKVRANDLYETREKGTIEIQVTATPIETPEGISFGGYLVQIQDITKLRESEKKLRQSFIELAETTSRVLGVRDPYTQKHELRVGELAREVGERMGLSEEKLLGLYIGGVLHDIGKIAIPETILTKPGELKDVEWEMIKSHPKVGYNQILEDTDFPWPVAEMTLHHHERLDGSGYPDGLEGDQLTTEVRILGAVDVVEAMSTRRPYREARSKARTLNVIKEGKGEEFDPEVVEVLIKVIEEGVVRFGGS